MYQLSRWLAWFVHGVVVAHPTASASLALACVSGLIVWCFYIAKERTTWER